MKTEATVENLILEDLGLTAEQVEEVNEEVQAVMKPDESADLQELATFDFQAYAKANGLDMFGEGD